MRVAILFSVLALPVAWGCIGGDEGAAPVADTLPPVQQTKLKPPSELALLMRDMAAFSDSARARMNRGEALPAYPEQFKAIHTATPTDGVLEMDKTTYDRFADHYLQQALYDAAPAGRNSAFNATLTACGNCHTVVCPGPMVKIKRMYLPLP
jgi:hypothetical protein